MTIFIVLTVVVFLVLIISDKRVFNKIKSFFVRINERIKNNRSNKVDKQSFKPEQKRVDTDVIPDKTKLKIENKPSKIDLGDRISGYEPDYAKNDDPLMNELDDLIKEIYFDGSSDSATTPIKMPTFARRPTTDFDNLYDTDFSDDYETTSLFDTYSSADGGFAKRFRSLPKEMQILIVGDVLKRKYY